MQLALLKESAEKEKAQLFLYRKSDVW